jgi:ABC-type Zn2+ transport system substrate-binding protein/surface adhesin
LIIDPANTKGAAARIAGELSAVDARSRAAKAAAANLARWNMAAAHDRTAVLSLVARLAGADIS